MYNLKISNNHILRVLFKFCNKTHEVDSILIVQMRKLKFRV